MPDEAARKLKIMVDESSVELGDWSLPSRPDYSLSAGFDEGALTAAIRAGGDVINKKISETKTESKLSTPVSNATLNATVD